MSKQRSLYFVVCHRILLFFILLLLKGGYLDFSHLTELIYINITEIYMRKQYKSSKIKNKKKITKTFVLMGVPLKGYVAS